MAYVNRTVLHPETKFHLHSADMCFLDKIQKATKRSQEICVKKGWTIYRNKNGEEVKLRHVLEKIHVWVGEIIKIVDIGVSADQSGHAALPWALVKLITEVGQSALIFKRLLKLESLDRIFKCRGFRQDCGRC